MEFELGYLERQQCTPANVFITYSLITEKNSGKAHAELKYAPGILFRAKVYTKITTIFPIVKFSGKSQECEQRRERGQKLETLTLQSKSVNNILMNCVDLCYLRSYSRKLCYFVFDFITLHKKNNHTNF